MRNFILGMFLVVLCTSTAVSEELLWFPFDHSETPNCGYHGKYQCSEYPTHTGMDYPCGNGTSLYSPITGTVVYLRNDVDGQDCGAGYGNHIIIQTDDNQYQVLLGHMLKNSFAVEQWDHVSAGEYVGKSSNSGLTKKLVGEEYLCGYGGGWHLHLEVRHWENDDFVDKDPDNYWTSPLQYGSPDPTFIATQTEATITEPGPYHPGDVIHCTMKWRNDGTATWHNTTGSGKNYVELVSCNSSGQPPWESSYFYASGLSPAWISNQVPCTFGTGQPLSVIPGNTATFTFPGKIPLNTTLGQKSIYFGPVYNSQIMQGWNGNGFTITVVGSEPDPPPDPPSTQQLVSGPYQMVLKEHLTVNEVNGSTAWFTPTHYPVYGGNYSSTDSRVKLYCNGVQVTGYKENNRLYVTNYNANGFYEADYPQDKATLTKGGTYNGYRTLYAPSNVFGNTWGNTHASLIVRKYSTWVPAYKETGSNVIVMPESEYDPSATYTAEYSTVAANYSSYVSLGPGQMVYREALTVAFPTPPVSGQTVWFRTYYPVHGGNYGNTDARVQLYCNGIAVAGYKENNYLYVTNYNPNGVYEVDYPRPPVELTKGGTYNGYRTLYAPSSVWGGTWGNTHTSLVVREYSVGITAYKETGSNIIVIPESEYDANATYTAEYVEVWGTYAGKVATPDEPQGPISLPIQFTLSQNYPNPFNPVTTISFSLPQSSMTTLEVFNILGQKVTTLFDAQLGAGEHVYTWDAHEQASGIYFYRLRTEDAVETKKMLLLK